MPDSPIVHLILRLAGQEGACLACDTEDHTVEYRLFNVHADGSEKHDGLAICPRCAAAYGYRDAVTRGLVNFEALLVPQDEKDERRGLAAPGYANETRAAFAHLRLLVADGKLTAPPMIPAEQFVAGAA